MECGNGRGGEGARGPRSGKRVGERTIVKDLVSLRHSLELDFGVGTIGFGDFIGVRGKSSFMVCLLDLSLCGGLFDAEDLVEVHYCCTSFR